jgi:hypothetical protein
MRRNPRSPVALPAWRHSCFTMRGVVTDAIDREDRDVCPAGQAAKQVQVIFDPAVVAQQDAAACSAAARRLAEAWRCRRQQLSVPRRRAAPKLMQITDACVAHHDGVAKRELPMTLGQRPVQQLGRLVVAAGETHRGGMHLDLPRPQRAVGLPNCRGAAIAALGDVAGRRKRLVNSLMRVILCDRSEKPAVAPRCCMPISRPNAKEPAGTVTRAAALGGIVQTWV